MCYSSSVVTADCLVMLGVYIQDKFGEWTSVCRARVLSAYEHS